MTLTTPYLPSYTPQNESERLAGIASSNMNCLAVGGNVLSTFRSTSFGQHPATATPTGASTCPVSGEILDAATNAANGYVALTTPATANTFKDAAPPTGIQSIAASTGSTWQKVALASLGNLTAF